MLNKPSQPDPGKGTQTKSTGVGMLRRDDKAGASPASTDRAAAALVLGALVFLALTRRAFRGALGD